MDFSCISEREARLRYKEARDKEQELELIADLTGSNVREVLEFLGICDNRKFVTNKRRSKLVDINGKAVRKSSVVCCGKLANTNVLELYMDGLCDREIAEQVGVSRTTVRLWRKKNRLPFNYQKPEYPERMALYRKGYNDVKIARELGVTRACICAWRHICGLPAIH